MNCRLATGSARCAAALLISLATLASCGGGVDSGGTGAAPQAVASGPITGLGSITVEGVRFDVGGAALLDQDGRSLTTDQLQVGMIAEVDATSVVAGAAAMTSTALKVRIRDEIIGAVASVNRAGTLMTVLGQPVRVTVATWFDPSLAGGISSINVGDVIEVWAQYNARTGEYVATRVAPRTGAAGYELRGILTAFDSANSTIVVGGLTISLAALQAADRPTLTVGQFVRVGLQTVPTAGVWTATSLAVDNGMPPDRPDARWSGRISTLTSASRFVLNDLTIDASAAVFPDNGIGVVLGARVAVTGSLTGGVLHAAKVTVLGDETLANSAFELHGAIEAWDPNGRTLKLHGILVRVGSGVHYSGGTAGELADGRAIDVVGTLDSDGASVDARSIVFE